MNIGDKPRVHSSSNISKTEAKTAKAEISASEPQDSLVTSQVQESPLLFARPSLASVEPSQFSLLNKAENLTQFRESALQVAIESSGNPLSALSLSPELSQKSSEVEAELQAHWRSDSPASSAAHKERQKQEFLAACELAMSTQAIPTELMHAYRTQV